MGRDLGRTTDDTDELAALRALGFELQERETDDQYLVWELVGDEQIDVSYDGREDGGLAETLTFEEARRRFRQGVLHLSQERHLKEFFAARQELSRFKERRDKERANDR